MGHIKGPIGKSRYRQLRLTATHELNGRFSVSLYGKGLNQEWTEHSCLARFVDPGVKGPLNSTEDVVMALLVILESFVLPASAHSPTLRIVRDQDE